MTPETAILLIKLISDQILFWGKMLSRMKDMTEEEAKELIEETGERRHELLANLGIKREED